MDPGNVEVVRIASTAFSALVGAWLSRVNVRAALVQLSERIERIERHLGFRPPPPPPAVEA